MTRQSVLTMMTKGSGLRSEAQGWSFESGGMAAKVPPGKPVGFIPSPRGYEEGYPACPLRALSAGWKLLAPPGPASEGEGYFEWWFVRDDVTTIDVRACRASGWEVCEECLAQYDTGRRS